MIIFFLFTIKFINDIMKMVKGMNGVVIVDKPKGMTSRDVVNIVSKKYSTKKVGHTGTLDPIATGVLVLCIGKATKLVSRLTSLEKEYIATVILGTKTDTLDITGNIIDDKICIKTKEEIEEVLKNFIGSYNQEVPKYSAVKINGKKLYEYARENKCIPLPKRLVNIKSIELLDNVTYENNKTTFSFKCEVSKGTYIRSLINDIAQRLNTIGVMSDLRRVKQGNFDIKDSIKLEDLSNDNVIAIKDVLNIKKIKLTNDIRKKVLNGAPIDNIYNEDEILFVDEDEVALYKSKDNRLISEIMFKGGN